MIDRYEKFMAHIVFLYIANKSVLLIKSVPELLGITE